MDTIITITPIKIHKCPVCMTKATMHSNSDYYYITCKRRHWTGSYCWEYGKEQETIKTVITKWNKGKVNTIPR